MGSAAPTLSMRAGDRTVHSSVVARHGLRSSLVLPRQRLQIKLNRKKACAATVRIVATVINVRSDAPGGTPSELPNVVPREAVAAGPPLVARVWAIRPSQCMGINTQ